MISDFGKRNLRSFGSKPGRRGRRNFANHTPSERYFFHRERPEPKPHILPENRSLSVKASQIKTVCKVVRRKVLKSSNEFFTAYSLWEQRDNFWKCIQAEKRVNWILTTPPDRIRLELLRRNCTWEWLNLTDLSNVKGSEHEAPALRGSDGSLNITSHENSNVQTSELAAREANGQTGTPASAAALSLQTGCVHEPKGCLLATETAEVPTTGRSVTKATLRCESINTPPQPSLGCHKSHAVGAIFCSEV